MRKILSIALLICLLASCAPSAEPPASPSPTGEPTASPPPTEPEPTPEEKESVMDILLVSGRIHVNQLGYRPNDAKQAVLPQDADVFTVVRVSDGEEVFSGTASEEIESAASEETVRIADFSDVTEPGEYIVCIPDERSYPFTIEGNVYNDVRSALLKFYHYAKCGVDDDKGTWSHPVCHSSEAYVYDENGEETGVVKDVSGGWHDAGDYGRYVVPSAQTIAQLLWAYDLPSDPDEEILDVVWFKIEWMLKMQDEATGGVYHKVTCKNFPGLDVMPDKENDRLILSPVSPTATADFAAALAMASRFYPEHKETLLAAARRAWDWCVANPDAPGFKNPRLVVTGEYGDGNSNDERFWAACELYIATGEEKYHDYIKSASISTGLGWANMGTFGLAAYLFRAEDKADQDLYQEMRRKLIAAVSDIMYNYNNDPYGVSLGINYGWGSNMSVGNNAVTLLFASLLDDAEKENYRNAALNHMHYLLGKNTLSQSFVTGYGSRPARNPHHRPSVAKQLAVPGMVVGGPNKNVNDDPTLKSYCDGKPPAKCYVDHIDSYAANEVAIYWNSPMYLAAALLEF